MDAGWVRLAGVIALFSLISGCRATTARIWPQAGGVSIADPQFLEELTLTRRFTAGQPNSIKIVPDGSAVLFLRSQPRDNVQDLYEFDTRTGAERVLLTAEQILQGAEERLSPEEKARRERMRLTARGIAGYQLSKDGTKILVPLSGRLFVIERATAAVRELSSDKGFPLDPRFSPDGRSIACVREGNLYVLDIATGQERQLTFGADANISFGQAEFVAQEEMYRREGFWWSPQSDRLIYQRTDTSGMETMHIMDAMYPERPPQSWAYPRPGKKNADVQLGIIPAAGGETTWIEWDREQFPYLATVRWSEEGPPFLLVQNRAQTEEILFQIDSATGRVRELLRERDDAWLVIEQEMPRWLPGGREFLWMSEREGAAQLEVRGADGSLSRVVVPPAFGLREFLHLDVHSGVIHILASTDPTQAHVFRIEPPEAGGAIRRLTTDAGMYDAVFAEQSGVLVIASNTLDGRRENQVHDGQGRELGMLTSKAQRPPFIPNIELTTVGPLDFRAVIIRPRNFNPRRRYPVIDSVYGGPHSQTVLASGRNYILQQWLADHGFIVVSIDGRGTASRGRAWERVVKGDLIEIPLADQVNALEALGRKYPEMDLSRVGIYGWSFGGYFSAMAVMRRPDMFDVGVAGAPVADWRDYDTHYTERYMGLPDENSAGYDRASVLTYCKELQRPLLIIHGTADDNVYFMHTLKMSNALFRAGRQHELLTLSDFTHIVADPLVNRRLYERISGFLMEGMPEHSP